MHLNNEGEKLTERELQIAILICKDKFSKQIAAELEIEISTVDSHKKHQKDNRFPNRDWHCHLLL
jgi:FixJ family two-component response regulator